MSGEYYYDASSVRAIREDLGLSVNDVANSTYLGESAIRRAEDHRQANPQASTLLQLANRYHVNPGKFFDQYPV